MWTLWLRLITQASSHSFHTVHCCRHEKRWQFISCRPLFPLCCFMAAALCEWLCVVSPLSSWCLIVCASAEIDPLFPLVHPATAAITQTDAAHWPSLIDSKPAGVSFTLHACVCFCVVSHPLHAAFSNSDYTDGSEEQSQLKPDRKIRDERVTRSPCELYLTMYLPIFISE